MTARKEGPDFARVSVTVTKERPSIMEFTTISLTGAAPAHVQARVLAEHKANQERIKQLGSGHG